MKDAGGLSFGCLEIRSAWRSRCCKAAKIIAQAPILGNNKSLIGLQYFVPWRCGRKKVDGIHLLGEWYGCPADAPEMTRSEALRALCLRVSKASGMTIVGERFFQFEPQGVTGTVLLAESHLAIHTWPEHGFVTIDVYVCNYTTDNTDKAERLFRSMQEALRPQRTKYQAIHRGGRDA